MRVRAMWILPAVSACFAGSCAEFNHSHDIAKWAALCSFFGSLWALIVISRLVEQDGGKL